MSFYPWMWKDVGCLRLRRVDASPTSGVNPCKYKQSSYALQKNLSIVLLRPAEVVKSRPENLHSLRMNSASGLRVPFNVSWLKMGAIGLLWLTAVLAIYAAIYISRLEWILKREAMLRCLKVSSLLLQGSGRSRDEWSLSTKQVRSSRFRQITTRRWAKDGPMIQKVPNPVMSLPS